TGSSAWSTDGTRRTRGRPARTWTSGRGARPSRPRPFSFRTSPARGNCAWIGVNGGLALGKDADDTLDVNANGFGSEIWDFPYEQKSGRADSARAEAMPGMFISPFWNDMILGEESEDFGRI